MVRAGNVIVWCKEPQVLILHMVPHLIEVAELESPFPVGFGFVAEAFDTLLRLPFNENMLAFFGCWDLFGSFIWCHKARLPRRGLSCWSCNWIQTLMHTSRWRCSSSAVKSTRGPRVRWINLARIQGGNFSSPFQGCWHI
jgi:hypothetical protein